MPDPDTYYRLEQAIGSLDDSFKWMHGGWADDHIPPDVADRAETLAKEMKTYLALDLGEIDLTEADGECKGIRVLDTETAEHPDIVADREAKQGEENT